MFQIIILRYSQNLHCIATRTKLYYNSFLPSVKRDWNDLPISTRQLNTVNTFKTRINRETVAVPKYFYDGNRKTRILHTRLCTHCSSLNMLLFSNNITDSPLCGYDAVENASHFFSCPLYNAQRISLLNDVSQYQPKSLKLLLYGNASLQQMPSYFRRYKSIYEILNNLLNNTVFTIDNTCAGI